MPHKIKIFFAIFLGSWLVFQPVAAVSLPETSGVEFTVPTNDVAYEQKETGIKLPFIPVKLPFGWDTLAVNAAQVVVGAMVNSTVNWINSGFDGGPAFVQNPGAYYGGLAKGIVGDYINGSDLKFLCSPFKVNVQLSLQKQYFQPPQFQCTLDQVVGNIQNFYDDFDKGGLNGWFTMTQEPQNNPYDSFINAQVNISSNLANALDLQKQQLSWGQGFMSFKDNNGNIKTPGSVIKDQLNKVLPAGFQTIISAQDFDKILSALGSQLVTGLLTNRIFSSKGLTDGSAISSSDLLNGSGGNKEQVQCAANPNKASVGDTIHWTAYNSTGAIEVEYKWSGDVPDSARTYSPNNTDISIAYVTGGSKTASVTASLTDALGNHKEITAVCSNSVLVSQYRPLTVSCSPNVQTAKTGSKANTGDTVTWTGTITGGSGNFSVLGWDSTGNVQGMAPGEHDNENKIIPDDFITGKIYPTRIGGPGTEWVTSGNSKTNNVTINRAWVDRDGLGHVTVETISQNVNSTTTTTTITLSRIYLTHEGDGSRAEALRVIDADNTLAAVNQQCSSDIYIYDPK